MTPNKLHIISSICAQCSILPFVMMLLIAIFQTPPAIFMGILGVTIIAGMFLTTINFITALICFLLAIAKSRTQTNSKKRHHALIIVNIAFLLLGSIPTIVMIYMACIGQLLD